MSIRAVSEASLLADRWVMNTYRRRSVTFVRGKGTSLFDAHNREFLDFVGGIAVTALGHAHPEVAEAVASQSKDLVHTSNLYYTRPMAELAERLCGLLGWGDGRVFFSNSGAESNECAIKLVRKWSTTQYSKERFETVAALGSFHGRTLETLAATGQPAKWDAFQPLPPGFVHVAYNDTGVLEEAITPTTCSVLLEPVQGEGGVIVPSDTYLPDVRSICDRNSLAFIADEVQTGIGRTGEWFAFQHSGAAPDVITLAKALGNGLPIGACVARGDFANAFEPGDHATTMGGGPVICAAALKVLEVIERDELVGNAAQTGRYLRTGLESLAERHESIADVRGRGLLQAIELSGDEAGAIVDHCFNNEVLINDVNPSTLRFSPALIVTMGECDRLIDALDSALTALSAHK